MQSLRLPTNIRILPAAGSLVFALAAIYIIWQAGLPEHPRLTYAPAFEAPTLDGQIIHIDRQLQEPVIINFWATWCEPCIIEMPRLENAYQNGVLVIGINSGEDTSHLQNWVQEHDINFPIVIDQFGELQQGFKVRGFPTTIFVDDRGRVQKVVEGLITEKGLIQGLAAIDG